MILAKSVETPPQFNQYVNHNTRVEVDELEKILTKLGLHLSPSELHQLYSGKFVSLENLTLGEVGSIFILASAISCQHFQQKNVFFRDLLLLKGNADSFGIPLHCWNHNCSVKHCLRLTFLEGVPVIVIKNNIN